MATKSDPRVCVAAIMKNEAPYILEWVAWYRLLGFEVLIADNGGDDGQTELLQKLELAGLIRLIDVRPLTKAPQLPCYCAFFSIAKQNGIDFLGLLDADEFFEPVGEGLKPGAGADLIRQIFAKTGSHALCFNWMCFGSSGETVATPRPVTERFVWAAQQDDPLNRHFKSFFDVAQCYALAPEGFAKYIHAHGLRVQKHDFCHDGGPRIGQQKDFGLTQTVSWSLARIRHYVVKSQQEFAIKRSRGRADDFSKSSLYDSAFFKAHDKNEVFAPLSSELQTRLHADIQAIQSHIDGMEACPPKHLDPVLQATFEFYEYQIAKREKIIAKRNIFSVKYLTHRIQVFRAGVSRWMGLNPVLTAHRSKK